MSENQQIDSTVETDKPTNPKSNTHKPSKSVRERKKQAHLDHVNKGANAAKEAFMDKKYFSMDTISGVLEQIRNNQVQKVAREFPVSLDPSTITTISDSTVDYLYQTGKMTPDGNNGVTDKRVLSKVLETVSIVKIHEARRLNGKMTTVRDLDYSTRVKSRFTVLPKLANDYVSNIGFFNHSGQVFVPSTTKVIQFTELRTGVYRTGITKATNGVVEYCVAIPRSEYVQTYVDGEGLVTDPFQMVTSGHGTIEWISEPPGGNFSQLCQAYEDFINRCSRKVANVMQIVDFSGTGSVSQLVGSRDLENSYREIWCNKDIDQGALMIGGLFGYGFNNKNIWYDEEIACVRSTMDMAGIFINLQRTQRI